jgi:hypothetical protein
MLDQIQGYGLWFMPAMDFCNTMEFPIATLWIFNLQPSVFLSYNKQTTDTSLLLGLKEAQISKVNVEDLDTSPELLFSE